MQTDISNFLLTMMRNLSSSSDLNIVLTNSYNYLKEFFPLAGISLHHFLPNQKAVQTLFFVNDTDCHYINKVNPLTAHEYQIMTEIDEEKKIELLFYHDCKLKQFIAKHFLPFINNDNPSILATPLAIEKNEIIGHILFFSKKNTAFNNEHIQLFSIIKDMFTSTSDLIFIIIIK